MSLLLTLWACSPDPTVTITSHEELPSIALVQWTSDTARKARVRLERDGETVLTTPLSAESGTDHTVPVAGLRHGVEHTFVPEQVDADGTVHPLGSVVWRAPSAPADLPLFTLAVDQGDTLDGYVALHTLDRERDAVVIVDRAGEVVWWSFVDEGLAVLSVALSDDGRALWYVTHATDYVETGATIHHVALDGSFHETYDRELAHSGVSELPDGGFATLHKASRLEGEGTLLWDEIWEEDADGNATMVFSFDEAFDPEQFCFHYDSVIPTDTGEFLAYDWSHANSLLLSDDEQAWILMVRHYDAVMRIDRATGSVEWILGGPHSNVRVETDRQPLDHAHMSWYQDGELLLFDNGNHQVPTASRLVGYALDEEALVATETLSWEDGEGTFSEWLGDVIALPDDTLLSSWTTAGRVLQTTREGELIWELDSESFTGTGRLVWLDGFYGPPDG